MTAYLRPHRGTYNKAKEMLIGENVLKSGEIFFEYPDDGPGSGLGRLIMGDGISDYANLKPFLSLSNNSTKDTSISDNVHASTTVLDNTVQISIQGVSLFSGYTGAYVNANLSGFYIDNIGSLPATLGLVFGKDSSNNVYYLACISTGIGDIFQVTPSGGYTRIISQTYSGSGFKKVIINSFESGILSFSIYNNSNQLVTTQTRNVSSYNINTSLIGFIPYSNNANVIITPLENYKYNYYNPENILDTLLPKLVNKTKTYKIRLIGDSITAGVGGSGYNATSSGGGQQIIGNVYQNIAGHCWANSLKDYLETKFSSVTVLNWGYSGATAQFIYQNINKFVFQDDNLIICMIGTNNRTSGDLNRLYINLENIVNYICNLQIPLVLMSSIPASLSNESDSIYTMHMEDINMIITAIAKNKQIPLISVYNLMKEYLKYTNTSLDSILVDGLHPNDTGYDIMNQLISNALGFTTPIDGYTWTPSVISA